MILSVILFIADTNRLNKEKKKAEKWLYELQIQFCYELTTKHMQPKPVE